MTTFLVAPPPEAAGFVVSHPDVVQMRTPRGLGGRGSMAARVVATVRRMASGVGQVLKARLRTRRFIITAAEILPVTLPLVAVLRLSGARVVVVVHDPTPHVGRNALIGALERLMLKALYGLASEIVVLSGSTRRALCDGYRLRSETISVIPEGMPTLDAPPLNGSRRLLLFGTIRANKMVTEAVQAVELAREAGVDVQLTIAGPASQGEEAYFASVAERASGKPYIRTELGYVDDARVAGLFAECDALLLPYRNFESHSGVALLAAAGRRPVIATTSGGITDLFREGMAGVEIEDCTPQAIATAIERFFAHPASYWVTRAEAAKVGLEGRYSWAAAGERYLALRSMRAG
ncbi:glycosyltransferase family 4 protein [Brevundimonas sp.]|uniref:glycosyltransferase family 4 protein n=1 Tax=Brevundimonas sp. TaxID=1871086 RepID=UPI003D135FB7